MTLVPIKIFDWQKFLMTLTPSGPFRTNLARFSTPTRTRTVRGKAIAKHVGERNVF
jgi:hypothetical protein